jgi:hypothetical protein
VNLWDFQFYDFKILWELEPIDFSIKTKDFPDFLEPYKKDPSSSGIWFSEVICKK